MTTSNNKQNVNTFTAKVSRADGSIEHYVGDKDRMSVYLSDDLGIWTISSTQVVNQEEEIYRDIVFFIHDDDVVPGQTYRISDVFPTPGSYLASAAWSIRTTSSATPFLGQSGQLKLTLDKTTNAVSGSFAFVGEGGESGARENVTLSSGEFNFDGLSVVKNSQPTPGSNVSAHINGLEELENFAYRSTEVTLTHHLAGPNLNVIHWAARSKQVLNEGPGVHHILLSVYVAESLELNKPYTLSVDSLEVRAFCIDLKGSFLSYPAVSGIATFTSLPAKGSSTGKLEGTINFIGQASGAPDITVSAGEFSIENK